MIRSVGDYSAGSKIVLATGLENVTITYDRE